VSTVSGNCFGRAYILAKALSRHYEVELLGQVNDTGVWLPCDTGEFPLFTTPGRRYPSFVKSVIDIVSHISGDVIYACKPLVTSYGIALLKKLISGVPVVLDIDDWELGIKQVYSSHRPRYFPGTRHPDAYSYVALLEHLVDLADEITTVSDFLRARFGRGIKVPHGRDVHWLDPVRYDRTRLRREWELEHYKVILWLGSPAAEKGIEDLAKAVATLRRRDLKFLLVGAGEEQSLVVEAKEILGDQMIVVGMRPFTELPLFLSMADLIVLPQRDTPATVGQVPAKLFDAMAMAKPIISTNVSDIPQILESCGVVVEPGNVKQIADAISDLLDHPVKAETLGWLAREKCVREYSLEAMEVSLRSIFEQLV